MILLINRMIVKYNCNYFFEKSIIKNLLELIINVGSSSIHIVPIILG
jgi:hypothetical protein